MRRSTIPASEKAEILQKDPDWIDARRMDKPRFRLAQRQGTVADIIQSKKNHS